MLDIYDPTGSQIIAERSARMLSVHMSPAANPDQCPLGMDVLGTCTCQCNNVNSDGHVVAYTASWELVVSDIHGHNTISIFFYLLSLCVYICALLHNIAYSELIIYLFIAMELISDIYI